MSQFLDELDYELLGESPPKDNHKLKDDERPKSVSMLQKPSAVKGNSRKRSASSGKDQTTDAPIVTTRSAKKKVRFNVEPKITATERQLAQSLHPHTKNLDQIEEKDIETLVRVKSLVEKKIWEYISRHMSEVEDTPRYPAAVLSAAYKTIDEEAKKAGVPVEVYVREKKATAGPGTSPVAAPVAPAGGAKALTEDEIMSGHAIDEFVGYGQ